MIKARGMRCQELVQARFHDIRSDRSAFGHGQRDCPDSCPKIGRDQVRQGVARIKSYHFISRVQQHAEDGQETIAGAVTGNHLTGRVDFNIEIIAEFIRHCPVEFGDG